MIRENKEITDLIKELEIKKVLVVDDREENIGAAREYFTSLEEKMKGYGFKVNYSNSEKEAKTKIEDAFNNKEPYDLVLTDLNMENEESGVKVAKKAISHCALPYIITSFEHGATKGTKIYLGVKNNNNEHTMKGEKYEEKTWEEAMNYSLTRIKKGMSEALLIATLKAYKESSGKPIPENYISALF